jgi:two-component system cell cycle response regulator CtrA
MRVLLIEDEPTTAKSIELMLGSEGFNVYTTDLGEEGLDLGKLYDYDIILLDLNLPDMHGYDVLKKLRTAKVSTPVLILSGIGEMDSKVRALGFGADDYVTKPFHRDELVARIHAIVRRSKGHSQSVIRTGKLAVNLDAKTVEVDGARVHLTGKEYFRRKIFELYPCDDRPEQNLNVMLVDLWMIDRISDDRHHRILGRSLWWSEKISVAGARTVRAGLEAVALIGKTVIARL